MKRPLTRPQITRIVKEWQRRLRLDAWKVTVEWDKPCSDDSLAEVTFEDAYDIAAIRLSTKWAAWSLEEANQLVVHELLHLHERDLNLAVKSVAPLLGRPAYSLFYNRVEHEREGVVDRLALLLVDGYGCVR